MNKLKTRRAAKKRFTKTVTGKYIRRKAFKGHLLEKKSSKRKRNLSQKMVVSFGDSFALRSMMPYV
jgi:large subunit ribosomal protein L35